MNLVKTEYNDKVVYTATGYSLTVFKEEGQLHVEQVTQHSVVGVNAKTWEEFVTIVDERL